MQGIWEFFTLFFQLFCKSQLISKEQVKTGRAQYNVWREKAKGAGGTQGHRKEKVQNRGTDLSFQFPA